MFCFPCRVSAVEQNQEFLAFDSCQVYQLIVSLQGGHIMFMSQSFLIHKFQLNCLAYVYILYMLLMQGLQAIDFLLWSLNWKKDYDRLQFKTKDAWFCVCVCVYGWMDIFTHTCMCKISPQKLPLCLVPLVCFLWSEVVLFLCKRTLTSEWWWKRQCRNVGLGSQHWVRG